jgi:hypothetical protein
MDFSNLLATLTGAMGPGAGLPPSGPGLPDMSMAPAMPQPPPSPMSPSLPGPGAAPPNGMGPVPLPQPLTAQLSKKPRGLRDDLLEIAPMVLAMFAGRKNPHYAAAILQGVQRGQEVARKERDSAADQAQERREAFAKYMQTVAADAQQFDDPTEHAKYLQFARQIGTQAFGDTGSDWTQAIGFPTSKLAKKKQADALAKLKALESEPTLKGYVGTEQFEDFTVTMADGSLTKVRDLRTLAGLQLRDPAGQAVAPKLAVDKPENLSEFEGYLKIVLDQFQEQTGRPATVGERRALYLKAKKEYGQADDRPTDPTLLAIRDLTLQTALDRQNAPSGYTPAQDRAVNQLADDFARDSKDYIARSESYDTVSAASQDASAAGDLSLIFAFMKMLDPGSVVREGEFATAQNSTGVPDRVRNKYNEVLSGVRLNPAQRADFVRQAKTIYATAKVRHRRIRDSYTARALRRGLNPDDVVMEYGSADEPPPSPKAGTTKIGRFDVTVSK